MTEQLKQTKADQEQSAERVEELVLGLGKESAGVISQYEQKIAAFEAERAQLLTRIEQLTAADVRLSVLFAALLVVVLLRVDLSCS